MEAHRNDVLRPPFHMHIISLHPSLIVYHLLNGGLFCTFPPFHFLQKLPLFFNFIKFNIKPIWVFHFSIWVLLIMMPFACLSPTLGPNKVLKLGLWAMWLSGFLLVVLSLYSIQLLPPLREVVVMPEFGDEGFKVLGNPTVTMFTVPRPFNGSIGSKQAVAIRSWLGLSPLVSVVLFGNDPSLQSFAGELGCRVLVEPNIDFTFTGTPFFHSIVTRAQAFSSDVAVLLDPETILLSDFVSTLKYAHELDQDWFLIASPRRISQFPFYLEEGGKHWLREDHKGVKLKKDMISHNGDWDCCDGKMLMAWNNGNLPLHMGVVPPFLYGKGLHNNWFINEVFYSKYRFVFDASRAISSFYLIDSGYHGNELEKQSWEYDGNRYLGQLYGLLNFREANVADFVKLVQCHGKFVFTNSALDTVYSFGNQGSSRIWKQRALHYRKEKRIVNCLSGLKSAPGSMGCSTKVNLNHSVSIQLPFSLEGILQLVADKNKTVVLAVAGYSYKDMLMSWVCRLRNLQITNFLVCALDDDTYQFSVLQGLPVYRDHLAPSNISFNDCHFGTKCFQKVTKTKSRLVLQILKLGYNVLMSDVDVYWFKNPLSLVQSFGPGVLACQSDEYHIKGPINLPRRLNSGFYYANSDKSTIAAMEKVVKHALSSELSEQPSFYDTLCGEGGSNRLGDNQCREPETDLTVQFLDRDLFPNGAYEGLWEKSNVKAACIKKGCYVLHNNWISGRLKKLERQLSSGLWHYDIDTRMCLQSWHKMGVKSYI